MDDREEGGSPLAGAGAALKRVPIWAWLIGGGVLLFLLLGRGRGAPAALVAQEGALADSINAADVTARQKQQAALDAMELKRAEQAFNLESLFGGIQEQQFKRQLQIETQLTQKVGRMKPSRIKCQSGRTTIDPVTGAVYCRQEQSAGFFSGINLGKLFDAYSTYQTRGVKR
jgi:hypothetical protein